MKQYTPMIQQYLEVKEKHKDALVFYRLGDFYEMFFEDAKIASNELDLILTGRNAGVEEKVPMCGVPHHAVTPYIQRLVSKGYKVAIVEQLEDAGQTKGIVKRDVVKIITPGTIMEDTNDDKNSVYIASIIEYTHGFALSFCEMATGENYLKSIDKNITVLKQQLLKNNVREVVVESNFNDKYLKSIRESGYITISYCDAFSIDSEYTPLYEEVKEAYYIKAFGLLLNYLANTQKRMMNHLRVTYIDNEDEYVYMDFSTQQNLELTVGLKAQAKTETLWSFMDKCQTAMGSRTLKKWIEKPLVSLSKIQERQNVISYFNKNFIERIELKDALKNIYDLDRLVAKLAYGSANTTDCIRIRKSLKNVPALLACFNKTHEFKKLGNVDSCFSLYQLLENALVELPPATVKEGGVFKAGYDTQLDSYRILLNDGKDLMLALETKEREKTGIKNLKIGYNRVFGYYFEVSKANIGIVKEEEGYSRKQTLTNAERFTTKELKELEDRILQASELSMSLETQLYQELIDKMKEYLPKLQQLAFSISMIDALYALCELSSQKGYVQPHFNKEGIIEIEEGRHPILDELMKEKKYVSNDLKMDKDRNILMITGPNMGGKSTYMRQCALISIMAQIGCNVPAKSANLVIFDKVFTRLGASDDILSGQSTFMVEMNEANQALKYATENSLILFDEIGRGTSTYDGMALAQSMLEYIAVCIKAKTLFSTHYHELTEMQDKISTIQNVCVDVYEQDDVITFLYRIKEGKADRSYGINVAKLAKLPKTVIDRSKKILEDLENNQQVVQQSFEIVELNKIPTNYETVMQTLSDVDINQLTPLEALQLLSDLKKKI